MRYQIGQVNRLGNRRNNQDRALVVKSEEGILLVLGDGMGGQPCGEVAAEILVEQARQAYLGARRPVPRPEAFLREVVIRSHHAITEFGRQQAPPVLPGTTAVLCLIQHGEASWVHVGDSRLYIYRQGLPIYRTTDHSYVEELFQQGRISRREQETHPQRNQVTECLGMRLEEPAIAVGKPQRLEPGDIVLLCSDGLWGPLDDALMGSMLVADEDLERSLYQMAERAEQLSYPHSDNISAVALRAIAGEAVDEPGAADAHGTATATSDLADAGLQSAIARIEQTYSKYRKELRR